MSFHSIIEFGSRSSSARSLEETAESSTGHDETTSQAPAEGAVESSAAIPDQAQPVPPGDGLPADEFSLSPGAVSSATHSNPAASPSVGDAPAGGAPTKLPEPLQSDPSSDEGPVHAEEGAQSQSVRTAGKGQKPSGGRLPPAARDPHRLGSFVRGETENVRRKGNVPASTPGVSENTHANIPQTRTVQ